MKDEIKRKTTKEKNKDNSFTTFLEELLWFPPFYIFFIIGCPTFIFITLIKNIIAKNSDWALYTLYLFPILWVFFVTYTYWLRMKTGDWE